MGSAISCGNHPSRPAAGVCVVCGGAHCDPCLTKVDGINHCARCLDGPARRGTADRRRREPGAARRLGGLLVRLLAVYLLAWWVLSLGVGR